MIIILAVIALISVPIVLNIIESARKSAFLSTAYGLIESAKLTYTENLMDGNAEMKTYVYPFEGLKFSGNKPSGGMIRIDEHGDVEIAIYNSKWCASKNKNDSKIIMTQYKEANCIIKDSEKDPVIILNGEKEIIVKQGEIYKELGAVAKTVDNEELEYTLTIILDENVVEKVDTNIPGRYKLTYQTSNNGKEISVIRTVIVKGPETFEEIMQKSTQVMSNDPDHNLRYVGIDPANYVKFNNELWRVIGVFNGQAKIISSDYYSQNIGWDKPAVSGGNGSYGWNDWNVATLKTELNTTYLNSMDSISQNYIDQNYTWTLGGSGDNTTYTRSDWYRVERGSSVYSGHGATWKGAISLLYPSDYGYATSSKETYCDESMFTWDDSSKVECKNNNWLYDNTSYQWTVTPRSDREYGVFRIHGDGNIIGYDTFTVGYSAKPVLYLKKEVKVKSGSGTKELPFELINE